MTFTQDQFDEFTRDDLEKLKFVLDTEGNVAVRVRYDGAVSAA